MWLKAQVTTSEKEEVRSSLHNVLTPFIWTLLAFSWTMVVQEILNIFETKYELPEVAIVISVFYAVTMTIFWVAILIYGKRSLNFIVDLAVSDEHFVNWTNNYAKWWSKHIAKEDEDFE